LEVIANFTGLKGNPPLPKGEEESIVSGAIHAAAIKDGVIKNTSSKRPNIKDPTLKTPVPQGRKRRLDSDSLKTFTTVEEANTDSAGSGMLPRPVKRQRTQQQRLKDVGNALRGLASFATVAGDAFLEMAEAFEEENK
jgi:hypothetical protein